MPVQARRLAGTQTTDTITLASLASNLLAGQAGTAVNHDTNREVDSLVQVRIRTGTSPTAGRIEIWAGSSLDGTSFTGSHGGTDAAFTSSQPKETLRLLDEIPTDTTSDKDYISATYSLAQAFGGTLPSRTFIAIFHNTGVNLNATAANHWVKRTAVHFQSEATV